MADIIDIDVVQNVTSVSFEVEPNTNIININKVTGGGGGAVPSLQEVTDVDATTTNSITANSFIKTSGTSSQFLKANGSVDSNIYGIDSNLVHKTGAESIAGLKTFTNGIFANSNTETAVIATSSKSYGLIATSNSSVIPSAIFNISQASNPNEIVRFQKEGTTLASVTNLGSFSGLSFIKTGGTSSQFLMADGSVSTGGATPTLQQVTTAGASSTNPITITTPANNGLIGITVTTNDNTSGSGLPSIKGIGVGDTIGIIGVSDESNGILGTSTNGNGVLGFSTTANGVMGVSTTANGLVGYSDSGTGSYVQSLSGVGAAVSIGLLNTSNIAEFKKNFVNQASISHDGKITSNAFIKNGGTSSQILAADGSIITAGNNITITGGKISSVGGAGGGGSSVNYYLNGGTSQGVFGGTTYYEFSKTAVIGTGADFNISSNGYIASFITEVADPSLLLIPAGNWNLEFFFSSSSAGGSPSFYAELYKYDGVDFTLIASNSTTPEGITNGTAIDAYFSAIAVPETVLNVSDRLAIRIFVNTSSKTITLHTQNSHLCEVITTFTAGLTALNGLQVQVQNFSTGTTGTDFAINSSGSTHTFNLPSASATARGVVTTGSQTLAGDKIFTGNTTANSFIKSGGTSSQFLMADGSTSTGGGATPTLQDVTTAGAITTNKITVNVSDFLPAIIANNTNGLGIFASSDNGIVGRFNLDTAENTSNIVEFQKNGVNQAYVTNNGTIVSNELLVNTTTDNGVDKLQVNGTASGSVATLSNQFVTKSQLDLKANNNEVVKLIVNEFPNSTVNGTLSETLLSTFTIPAGTLPASCMPDIRAKFSKSGDGGTSQMRLKINTVNNFATSTQIATYTAALATDTFLVSRNPVISGGNMNIIISSSAVQSDISGVATTESNFTIDVANTIYLFVSVTQGAAGDTTTLRAFKIIN